jgi:hypothetical protein
MFRSMYVVPEMVAACVIYKRQLQKQGTLTGKDKYNILRPICSEALGEVRGPTMSALILAMRP